MARYFFLFIGLHIFSNFVHDLVGLDVVQWGHTNLVLPLLQS